MNKLALENEHPRDKFLEFYEPTHTYTVHGEKGYTSVTTFIHKHFEPFNADKIINGILMKNSDKIIVNLLFISISTHLEIHDAKNLDHPLVSIISFSNLNSWVTSPTNLFP